MSIEMNFLLDDLLQQDGINRDVYTQLNNMLAESLNEDDDEIESTKDEAAKSTKMKMKHVKESRRK